MRILVHSYVFRPSVGGIEVATYNLARGLSALGHQVTVLTDTLERCDDDLTQTFRIVRTRDFRVRAREVGAHDIVHATGAFPACFIPARLFNKPFIWTHAAYRLLNIDGLGWSHGQPSPMSPVASFQFHRQDMGTVRAAVQLFGIGVRRIIAGLVDANVAITHHMMKRQPAPRQQVIYNPVDCNLFGMPDLDQAMARLENADCEFAFLGRLVSEKGVECLVRAFAIVTQAPDCANVRLKIIGSGPERQNLDTLANELAVADQIRFVGALQGAELAAEIAKSGIFVLPSSWEEPMGIVAVELMAAGKPLIVSATGGLSECAGDACLTFPNNNSILLAEVMLQLIRSRGKQQELVKNGLRRCQIFTLECIAKQYIELFERVKR